MDAKAQRRKDENELSHIVVGAAIDIHKELGPGLFESAYEECLCMELRDHGLRFQRQLEVPLIYRDTVLETAYRLDLLVEDTLALELKATELMAPIHTTQLLTYIKLLRIRLGLVLNFGQLTMREGVTRVVNELPERIGDAIRLPAGVWVSGERGP